MRLLRPSSEAEMIAVFLRTELPSERWQEDLRTLLRRASLPEHVITAPDLGNDIENLARLRLLTDARVRYIEYDYWDELSGGTRLAVDAARRIHAGVTPFGGPTTGCWRWRRQSPKASGCHH
jgi:hypothetical protein